MPLLASFAPPSAPFNWEELTGDETFRVERHRDAESSQPLASVLGGVARRDLTKVPPFRIRLREFPKSVVAVANSEGEILADWERIHRAMQGRGLSELIVVKEIIAGLLSGPTAPEVPANPPRHSPIHSPPSGFPPSHSRDHEGSRRDGRRSPTPSSPVWRDVPAAGAASPSGPRRGVALEDTGDRNMMRLGAYCCSLRDWFVGWCRALRGNDPISVSIIGFLFLILYSMGHLSTLFLLWFPTWQAYVIVCASQNSEHPEKCIALAHRWVAYWGRRFDWWAQRPWPILALEIAMFQYSIIMMFARSSVLLLGLWALLLFFYLFPDEWIEPGKDDHPQEASEHSVDQFTHYMRTRVHVGVQATPEAEDVEVVATPASSFCAVDDIPAGYVGNLTPEQDVLLAWLDHQVTERIPEYCRIFAIGEERRARHLVKWLRMQRWDEAAALRTAVRAADWRETFAGCGVAKLSASVCDTDPRRGLVMYTGIGFARIPVLWVEADRHRRNSHDRSQVEMEVVYQLERALRTTDNEATGPQGETVDVLVNLTGFGIGNVDMDTVRHFATLLSQHYPETLHICIFLNAPRVFELMWADARTWLDPFTAGKVRHATSKELLDWVPRAAWHPEFEL